MNQTLKQTFFTPTLGQIGVFSAPWHQIVEETQRYHADPTIPVLIFGETGTGKEIVARLIHFGTGDTTTPFVAINCAALAPSLFESELFGYEAGSFTGGQSQGQRGKLDLAQGGTLLLDEISEIPLNLQAKLLRVLEEKKYYRVGGLKELRFNARVICTSNVDLASRVAEGKFRRDLYFRLRVGEINIPPLRERQDAILPLSQMFLLELSRQKGKGFRHIAQAAGQVLRDYPWPGNIRELRNTIEWAVFRHNDTTLKVEHLQILPAAKTLTKPSTGPPPPLGEDKFTLPRGGLALGKLINNIVHRAYLLQRGNKSRTARYLGISRSSLYTHLRRLERAGYTLKID